VRNPISAAGPAEDRLCNNLLRALRTADYALLAPFLSFKEAGAGERLYAPGDDVDVVYLPCGSALASYVLTNEDGREVEVSLVGREGAIGGVVSFGHLPAYCGMLVKFGGAFLALRTKDLETAKAKSPSLTYLFARYADCLMAQLFQSIACNASHSIEQRSAKWLLAAMDRTGGEVVPMTHEQLAAMLGVGRSYTSRVIHSFKARGLVETRRGSVVVLDQDALHARSCACNDAVRDHFDVVLRGVYPHSE